ncbi:MAG: cell wall hydrolase [Alphaproteobacteria bacterium]|nr:cell wall hydrolase [Alphaproteobacteria bacterium]
MLLRDNKSVLKTALRGTASALLLSASALMASAADRPAAPLASIVNTGAIAIIDAKAGIIVSGDVMMMTPIPDATRDAVPASAAVASDEVASDEIEIPATADERPTLVIKDGAVMMAPIGEHSAAETVIASLGRGSREQKCLARAIYFEARGESLRGQEAVAQVVLRRVKSPGRPNSICGVVYEGSHLSTGCQFSFTCDGIADVIHDRSAWRRALRIASRAMHGKLRQVARGAMYFHARYVRPSWARRMVKVATIGTHVFYRP